MSEKILTIPYKSQWDNDANSSKNDCGPASLAMVLNKYGKNVTTNEVLAKTGAGGGYVSFQQLQKVASEYGFTSRIERNRSPQRIKDLINRGIFPIVVVHYGYLSSRQNQKFKGPHIMVVVGYRDDGYFVNDPNFWGEFRSHGDHHFYKKEEFEKSWKQSTEDSNAANTLFFIQLNQDFKPEPPETSESKSNCKAISNFLVSVGYTYQGSHVEVVKTMHKSDVKLKSGEYILKKTCTKEKEELKTKYGKDVHEALRIAKKEWKVEELKTKVLEYEKMANSTIYKIAKIISKIFKESNIINKLGSK